MKKTNKILALALVIIFAISMTASIATVPGVNAHTPAWNIPTYAYIYAFPNPIGVGQTIQVYMWLDEVYGAAGGSTATVGTNGATASAALMSNNWRFHNYQLTITAPNGDVTKESWPVIVDTTSSQEYGFTASQVGTYTFNFTYPGQVYGADGNGYSNSILVGDTYLPSSASTTLTVSQSPVSPALGTSPLPTAYWESPIYGENSVWYSITSNWLGSGSPVPAGYTSTTLYHGDAVGPLTSHLMWTTQMQFGGVVGGNSFTTGGSYPGNGQGVQYFEGSSYQPRFNNPIIIDGYLFYTKPVSFTGPSSGATVCVNLMNGQQLWSSTTIPPISFGYVYNLWDPDQHGTMPPDIVCAIGGGLTGYPSTWEVFDAYTGISLFNVTNVPGFAPQTGLMLNGQPAVALTYGSTIGPDGEVLRDVLTNVGTSASPNWYMAEWNMSRLWSYDINPYTGGGSYSPSVMNATNGVMIPTLPIPIAGETGTLPNGGSVFIPYGSKITVDASTTITQGLVTSLANPTGKYDWNVSVPWLNTLPLQATLNLVTGALVPAVEQGTSNGVYAAGGSCPISVVGTDYGDMMLVRDGGLPTGFKGSSTGYPQLPYQLLAINLNSSVGAIGSVLWSKTYNPPAGNITVNFGAIDWQTKVFTLNYEETMQWVGYSLTNGNQIWGPTQSQPALDYYGLGNTMLCNLAYGNLYSSQMAGVAFCFSDTTGKLLWTYGNEPVGSDNSTYAGLNTPYGDYPTVIQSIANGVVYLATDEHTILNPIYKGATTAAINATTGALIWQLSDYPSEWSSPGTAYVVGDGFATFMNGYNNQIYSVGRGPSQTSVTANPVVTTFGDNIVIKGTVMDISAGTKQDQQASDFPNGVPVASDASMYGWMGYVYQQQPMPTTFTGVPVTISVMDSNGNYRTIGTATTNENGMYTLTWTPDIAGKYTVYANFAGTNGYWPSSSTTSFNIMNAAPTAAATASPISMAGTENTIMIGVAAIIVVIIVGIAVVVMLILRKRP